MLSDSSQKAVPHHLSDNSPWKLVIDNDTYRIWDLVIRDPGTAKVMWTLSRTELKPARQTRGHKHEDDSGELYRFIDLRENLAVMVVDNETAIVSQDDIVYVPPNVFHRVINPCNERITFETISAGPISRPVLLK